MALTTMATVSATATQWHAAPVRMTSRRQLARKQHPPLAAQRVEETSTSQPANPKPPYGGPVEVTTLS